MASKDAQHLVVFGAGPQAVGHVEAMRTIRPINRVSVIDSAVEKAQRLADDLVTSGLSAAVATPSGLARPDCTYGNAVRMSVKVMST